MKKILFIIFTIMFIFSFTLPVIAQTEPQSIQTAPIQEEPSIGIKILDILLVRPICIVGSTISTAVYLAISPVAFVMGLGEEAVETMVEEPWQFTSCRYVGDFNHYKQRCFRD
jgi:hypothetical protein